MGVKRTLSDRYYKSFLVIRGESRPDQPVDDTSENRWLYSRLEVNGELSVGKRMSVNSDPVDV